MPGRLLLLGGADFVDERFVFLRVRGVLIVGEERDAARDLFSSVSLICASFIGDGIAFADRRRPFAPSAASRTLPMSTRGHAAPVERRLVHLDRGAR